eukprot:scaffold29816_cov19-Tisochrysis_lutea.AAC.2
MLSRVHTHTYTNTTHTQLSATLKEFRMMSAAARAAANRLVLPESLRMLPLWMLCLIKSPALKGGAKVGIGPEGPACM